MNLLADGGGTARLPTRFSGSADSSQTIQRKPLTSDEHAPDSALDAARAPATAEFEGECTFKLKAGDIEYCFVAKEVSGSNNNRYQLCAYPSGTSSGADSPIYSVEIVIANPIKDGKRYITSPIGKIKLISNLDNKASISFDPTTIAEAWNQQAPVGASPWDFIVLEVYDPGKKELPIRVVYWMGGDWEKLGRVPATTKPENKVATFRIERSKLPAKYLEEKTDLGLEGLTPEKITGLIAGKSPTRVTVGFDPGTYVGMKVKAVLRHVEVEGPVDFEKGGGKKIEHSTNSYWVSETIPHPPKQVRANFKTNESALPSGLDSASLPQFKNDIKLVLLYLQDTPEVDIEIRAYTDTVGKSEQNLALSQARAESARKYLTDATIWTGAEGNPKALAADRITLAKGEGQHNAEEYLKKNYPKDWEKLQHSPEKWKSFIGDKADVSFRKVEIRYIFR
jgi:outer membrane protein OmpA-like peptidoglycan-associated protein